MYNAKIHSEEGIDIFSQFSSLKKLILNLCSEVKELQSTVNTLARQKLVKEIGTQTDHDLTVIVNNSPAGENQKDLALTTITSLDNSLESETSKNRNNQKNSRITNSTPTAQLENHQKNNRILPPEIRRKAYVVKGLHKKMKPYELEKQCKNDFSVEYCNWMQSPSTGKILKHIVLILENPNENILLVENLNGHHVVIEPCVLAHNKENTAKKKREVWNPSRGEIKYRYNCKTKQAVRNFERKFFRMLEVMCED